jgi:hypothetical protein
MKKQGFFIVFTTLGQCPTHQTGKNGTDKGPEKDIGNRFFGGKKILNHRDEQHADGQVHKHRVKMSKKQYPI